MNIKEKLVEEVTKALKASLTANGFIDAEGNIKSNVCNFQECATKLVNDFKMIILPNKWQVITNLGELDNNSMYYKLPCPLGTPVWFIGETYINGGKNVVYYPKQIPFTLKELDLFNERVFLTRIAMEKKLRILKKNNPCYNKKYES